MSEQTPKDTNQAIENIAQATKAKTKDVVKGILQTKKGGEAKLKAIDNLLDNESKAAADPNFPDSLLTSERETEQQE